MISRVAEGCFWLARHLERVETLARHLDVHHALHIDADVAIENRWRRVLDFTGQTEHFVERMGAGALDDGELVQSCLTWDPDHPSASTFSGAALYRTRINESENR